MKNKTYLVSAITKSYTYWHALTEIFYGSEFDKNRHPKYPTFTLKECYIKKLNYEK